MSLRFPPDINIRKLPGDVMTRLCRDLDTAPESQNWKAFVALLGRPYMISQVETEKLAIQIYSNGSPANQLILQLGGNGMCARELVHYLDKLRLEKILIDFKHYEPIRITLQPDSVVKLFVGECLILRVEATGFPYPRYQWFQGQNPIEGASENILKIKDVRLESSGSYCCRLHNSAEKEKVVFSTYPEVKVHPQPFTPEYTKPVKKRSHPPLQNEPSCEENNEKSNLPFIISHPRDGYILLGQTFYLKCEAKGVPPLDYIWYKDENFFSQSGILQVDNATPKDSGRYVCEVRNTFGAVKSIPAMITVAIDDRPMLQALPHITTHPSNCQVDFNGVALFTCEAVGAPPLRYQWFQDALLIQDAESDQLELRDVRQDAVFHCRVKNATGSSFSRKALLRVGYQQNYGMFKTSHTATDKVALLIGNFNYRCENSLKAPKSDVQFLSEIFRSLNYKVVSLLNLTLTEMKAAVAEFCGLIGDGVYCVFYFCGHGFEENGQCYFVPEDAQTGFGEKDCLCAGDVLANIQQKKPRNCTMIFDICRKKNKNGSPPNQVQMNRFDTSQGNCCICYATCPGMAAYEIGDSGILVKHLQQPLRMPMKIEDVFCEMREAIGRDARVKGKQIAEMTSNMLEKRSFFDPIDYRNGWTQEFTKRGIAWENAHIIPRPMLLKDRCPDLGIVLELEFQSCFSNVLQVYVTVKDKGITQECIAWIARMPSTVSVSESPSEVSEGKTINSIQDIQKLKGDLVVSLSLKYRLPGSEKSQEKMLEKINLDRPLVAPLKLWQEKALPKEPTEQTEEVDGNVCNGYVA